MIDHFKSEVGILSKHCLCQKSKSTLFTNGLNLLVKSPHSKTKKQNKKQNKKTNKHTSKQTKQKTNKIFCVYMHRYL